MHLVGIPLAQLLPIFGIAAAAIVGLYILKLRRRPVAVPFERLWARVLKDKEATSLFSRLKRLLSLLLQLAVLAALVFALGDPRTAVEVVKGRTLIVLVDTSASMKAKDGGGGRTRLELARDEVKKLVKGLGASDRESGDVARRSGHRTRPDGGRPPFPWGRARFGEPALRCRRRQSGNLRVRGGRGFDAHAPVRVDPGAPRGRGRPDRDAEGRVKPV